MVVEDNLEVSNIFATVFEIEGYKVLEARNGKAALMLMEEHRIDVILTDFRMPVMDGLVFAYTVKKDQRFSNVPIVLLSATPANFKSLALGPFAAFLEKPCPLEEVILTINKISLDK